MKSVLFYNTTAGNAPLVNDLVKELSREPNCRVVPLDRHSDQDHAIAAAKKWNAQRWVVAGGDGTLHRLVAAVGDHLDEIELGIVPCGTGNDFARSLDARVEDLIPLCTDSDFGTTHSVDLLQLGDPDTNKVIRCLNATTGGIGGEMASRIQAGDKRTWGPFAYWMSAISALSGMHGYALELFGEDQEGERLDFREIDAFGLVVSNGRFIGGGFPIAPSAALDDHLLDLMIVPELPALELLAAGIAAATGNIEHSSAIVRRQLKRLIVSSQPQLPISVDGEPQVAEILEFRIEPNAMRLVVPREAPGLSEATSRLEGPTPEIPKSWG